MLHTQHIDRSLDRAGRRCLNGWLGDNGVRARWRGVAWRGVAYASKPYDLYTRYMFWLSLCFFFFSGLFYGVIVVGSSHSCTLHIVEEYDKRK